jgi:hypothetical protein
MWINENFAIIIFRLFTFYSVQKWFFYYWEIWNSNERYKNLKHKWTLQLISTFDKVFWLKSF